MSLVKLFQIVSLSLGISLFSFLNSPIILSKTITDSSTTEQCTDDNSTIVEEILGSNQVDIDYCINEYVKCVDAPSRA